LNEVTGRFFGSLEDLEVLASKLKEIFSNQVWLSRPLLNERDPGYRLYVNISLDENQKRQEVMSVEKERRAEALKVKAGVD